MIVYGDRERAVDPAEALEAVGRGLAEAAESTGPESIDRLIGALILAGELAQGAADAAFERFGCDVDGPEERALLALAGAIATCLVGRRPATAALTIALRAARRRWPGSLRVKLPEGYAFYAVYPQAYAAAAQAVAWPSPPLVVALRSIGTSLGAVVAAAAGASRLVTLRPCGPPFGRELRPAPELRRRLAEGTGPVAIVDEGPGLSGSSFAAAISLARDLGREVVVFPSHANGPGSAASRESRRLWGGARQCPATFDQLLQRAPIGAWFQDTLGEIQSVEDLSAGAWRAGRSPSPPSWAARERIKFRLTAGGGVYLAKFAGLGAVGAHHFARAEALDAAGFIPAPMLLRRGFLVERWEAAAPLDLSDGRRAAFLRHLAAYLAFRARALPAGGGEGASLAELAKMALCNAEELGGPSLKHAVQARLAALSFDPSRLRRVFVDARLMVWEWLSRGDGGFLKTDALDHAADHDLVGAQDIAWDVAGAAVEFSLTADELAALAAAVRAGSGAALEHDAVATFRVFYAAFQAGYWSMAAAAAPAADRNALATRLAFIRASLETAAAGLPPDASGPLSRC